MLFCVDLNYHDGFRPFLRVKILEKEWEKNVCGEISDYLKIQSLLLIHFLFCVGVFEVLYLSLLTFRIPADICNLVYLHSTKSNNI